MNVWKNNDAAQPLSNQPLSKDEIALGDKVYVSTLVGIRHMTVLRDAFGVLYLDDDGAVGELSLDTNGHWFSGSLVDKEAVEQLVFWQKGD